MTKDKKVLLTISSVLFVLLSFALLLPGNNTKLITSLVLVAFTIVMCALIKKRSITSINKKQVLMIIGIIALVSLMLYYLTGLKFGFYKSPIGITFNSIINYIIPIGAMIITIEIIRYVLLAQENKFATIMSFIACMMVDVLIYGNLSVITTFNRFMDVIGLTLIPSITSNLLYHHISKEYGYYPNIVYRLILSLYTYFLPFVPATPDSFVAIFKLVIPIFIYVFITALYEHKMKLASKKPKKRSYFITAMLGAVMISIVMLISCQFKYCLIVIGSESMTGELNKGDALVYEKYENQVIDTGTIIVFKKDKSTIIHRVIEIEVVNNQTRYYTKGDANNDKDLGYVIDSQIIGIGHFKISYIGYPTIWIRNLFN